MIAQVKQFDALPVHQRQVDELRGACLRAGAAEAVLITTSVFSQAVRTHSAVAGSTVPPLALVRLIDGEELTALMVRHRLGVREAGKGGARRLEIDEAFFRGLAGVPASFTSRPRRQGEPRGHTCGLTRWRVTVRILRGRCGTEGRSGAGDRL